MLSPIIIGFKKKKGRPNGQVMITRSKRPSCISIIGNCIRKHICVKAVDGVLRIELMVNGSE